MATQLSTPKTAPAALAALAALAAKISAATAKARINDTTPIVSNWRMN
jgi:hypothetical protein